MGGRGGEGKKEGRKEGWVEVVLDRPTVPQKRVIFHIKPGLREQFSVILLGIVGTVHSGTANLERQFLEFK